MKMHFKMQFSIIVKVSEIACTGSIILLFTVALIHFLFFEIKLIVECHFYSNKFLIRTPTSICIAHPSAQLYIVCHIPLRERLRTHI